MSVQSALPFSRPSIFSAEASPARTYPPPGGAKDSEPKTIQPDPGSGFSSDGSSKRPARGGSSSKTWHLGLSGGCPECGETLGHEGMRRCPWASPPLRLGQGIGGNGSSSLLPTLIGSDASRGTSHGSTTEGSGNLREVLLPTLRANEWKAGGYQVDPRGQVWLTLSGMLPTLTARDHRSGNASEATHARPTARPLNETLGRSAPGKGCLLDPGWCEAFMGFPEGWTDLGELPDGPPPAYEAPESKRSETPLCPPRSSPSGS
jgi:hypothetical protein